MNRGMIAALSLVLGIIVAWAVYVGWSLIAGTAAGELTVAAAIFALIICELLSAAYEDEE